MTDKEIISEFNNLIARKVEEYVLKEDADKIKSDPFFIGEKAKDSRLDFNITTDIGFIHSDLIFTTGLLFALKPYINNPLKETAFLKGKEYSTYRQNMYDSFYSMYASVCFEKLYNFWDRIGDKIANEFSSKFPNPKRVMFANVIDKLKEDFETDENFMWLIAFRNDGFKDFNDKRKLVVHYEQIETKYQTAILDNIGDMQKIEEICLEKLESTEERTPEQNAGLLMYKEKISKANYGKSQLPTKN